MNEPKQKIRFVQDRLVKDHTGAVIDHFKTGQVKEMGAASARHWLNRGVAVEATGTARAAAPAPAGEVRPEGAALTADIVSKIDSLDENEDFTGGGVPSVPALTRALGYDISGAERDTGWAAFEALEAEKNKTPPAGKPAELDV